MYACQFKKSDDFGSYDEGWELILQTPVILPVPNEVVEGPGGRRILMFVRHQGMSSEAFMSDVDRARGVLSGT